MSEVIDQGVLCNQITATTNLDLSWFEELEQTRLGGETTTLAEHRMQNFAADAIVDNGKNYTMPLSYGSDVRSLPEFRSRQVSTRQFV